MPIVSMVESDALIPGAYLPVPLPREWIAEGASAPSFALLETHHGCVISEREMNGYDDSDFYALVWEPESRTFREILFASTRGWTYPCLATRADATPEVLAEWKRYCEGAAALAQYQHEQREARVPKVGRRVRVIAGRKVARGTEWYVVSREPDRFSRRGEYRLGLRADDGSRAWTSERNVEVIL